MFPRWKPSWSQHGADLPLIAYIGLLDVYYQMRFRGGSDTHERHLYVVGPAERKIPGGSHHNFDVYVIVDGKLELQQCNDVHIELHEMCELYQLAVERGFIKEIA